MFVRRVAGPSRLTGHGTIASVQTKRRTCKHTFDVLPTRIQHSQFRAASNNAVSVPATVDASKMSPEEQIELQHNNGAQVDRIGSRGAARNNMDELVLPTLDVKLIPKRPSDMKELYFWYYPTDLLAWPFIHRKLWNLRNWDWLAITGSFNPKNWTFSFQNPIEYFKERGEKGPKALDLWMSRVKNDYGNLAAYVMCRMAQYQRFPEYIWPESKLANRAIFQWEPIKNWKLRRREDKILTDLSAGDNSPLRRILLDAADVYVVMNTAVSEGKTSNLAGYADKTYFIELEKRSSRIRACRKAENPVDYKWEFGHWINPPQCLSIRANDYLAGYSKSYITGDRLYINMLVKFESVQTMIVTESFRNKAGELQRRKPEYHTREVTEYLVLDVRPWVPGRRPKFVQEVFEGQELTHEFNTIDPMQENKKPAPTEDASSSGEVIPTPTA